MTAGTYSGQGIDLPFSASGDLNAVQYRWVMPATTEGQVLQADGASGPEPVGVLQNDPRSLDAAAVRVAGTTLLYVDAGPSAILYGSFLTSGSTGLGVKQGGAGSNVYHALALQAVASGSGVLIEALLQRGQVAASQG